MKDIINQLPNDYMDMINIPMLMKEYDDPLVDYVFDALKGFEIIPNIKILSYEWDPNEENFDPNNHIVHRNANKAKVIKSISETRCGVMYNHVEIQGGNKKGEQFVYYIIKPIIIPITDDNGYFLIKGKRCYLIYQLVDKMLYPSFGAVTVKSLMPICVKTSKDEFSDTNGDLHRIPTYSIQIFKTAINVLMIYSHLGITRSLEFLEIAPFIRIEEKKDNEKPVTDDKVIRFECKRSNCIVAVRRRAFDQEIYVRSIVGCLINFFEENHTQYSDIDDIDYWMALAGGRNDPARGKYQHIFFNRLLDEVSRKKLPINDFDKQNIYTLLRWIIQNYPALWAKDNLSFINKRLRCNEYVSTFMTAEVSKRINRIVGLGNRATITDLRNAFKFPQDIFITRLYSSGVLRYAEHNSDIDFLAKLKFTAKGSRNTLRPFFS